MSHPEAPIRILVLFAHPAYQKSRVNRVLADAVKDLSGVTFHDLYETYPDFVIDVEREQDLLLAHQVIVFHHPFFWYSTPAILKEWQDLVLEHGWAYGSQGTALRGQGHAQRHHHRRSGGGLPAGRAITASPFGSFWHPWNKPPALCGMEYLPPFVAHGTHRMTAEEMAAHAKDYRRLLEAVRDSRVDMEAARSLSRLNADLDAVVQG